MGETITPDEYRRLAEEEGRRGSKYRNQRIVTEDGAFDRLGEERRWRALKLPRDRGAIGHLRRQVRYPLAVNGIKIATYVADFASVAPAGEVVEDFK